MIVYETHETLSHVNTPEGAQILKDGSHEARVWSVLPAKGQGEPLSVVQLKKEVGDETSKVGQGRAFKNGWIGKEGNGFVKLVYLSGCIAERKLIKIKVSEIDDTTQKDLQEISSTGTLQAGEKVLADLRKRKLIIQKYVLFPEYHATDITWG